MSEISIKRVCCTCLSTDRKLYQLCRILDGINLLYMLLSHDPDAYKKGFYRDSASLHICWECCAIVHRIKRFQMQTCVAQKQLASIAEGRNNIKIQNLSRLTTTHNARPNYEFQSSDIITENFIDCGPVKEIKTESDSDDVPLSEFYENNSDNWDKPGISEPDRPDEPQPGNFNTISESKSLQPSNIDFVPRQNLNGPGKMNINLTEPDIVDAEPLKIEVTAKKRTKMKYSKYFTIKTMSEEEMLRNIEYTKTTSKESVLKCDNCFLRFKTENELFEHNVNIHSKNNDLSKCDICHTYTDELHTHKQTHYQCYSCMLCTLTAYTHMDIVLHLKRNHKDICSVKKKGSKRRRNGLRLEEFPKYPCSECDLCFQNKDLRWKHTQKVHREGYKCTSCDKKFAFKNNLERHERIHQGSIPREECPTCHKMIRIDLIKVHSRIHTDRQKYTCVECDKSFISRETYESHLKYTQAHATVEVCRHKCPSCHKRYRSRGELHDHINYQHKGQAEHKCPICGKGLATKRCIRRHVRRAHEGIKESAKDKICQQCGKAFRDKKGLIEHERVHSGARPLSCATCGRAFRQRAALYAHTRRVHPVNDTS